MLVRFVIVTTATVDPAEIQALRVTNVCRDTTVPANMITIHASFAPLVPTRATMDHQSATIVPVGNTWKLSTAAKLLTHVVTIALQQISHQMQGQVAEKLDQIHMRVCVPLATNMSTTTRVSYARRVAIRAGRGIISALAALPGDICSTFTLGRPLTMHARTVLWGVTTRKWHIRGICVIPMILARYVPPSVAHCTSL